jgi:rod shape determining protein RodA
MLLIDRRIFKYFNYHLLGVAALIAICGLIVLYSAGYNPDSPGVPLGALSINVKSAAFAKQFAFFGAGLVAMLFGMLLSSTSLHRLAIPGYILAIILLLGVALFGTVVNGSRRWFDLGGLRFQPSELVKVAVILVMARYLSTVSPPPGGFKLKDLFAPGALLLLPMALIMKQPDLGTALVVGATGAGMLLFAGVNFRTLIMLALVAAISAIPVWYSLHDYQRNRILTLINPGADPLGSGYHLNQSKIAVGSGEFLGKGYLQGTQSQLEFLPEHTTDFVFSVLAEEWGFIGCILVIGLYATLIFQLLNMASKIRDLFGAYVIIGVATLFTFHFFTNIGMVIGVLPVVGITLPLFSYGGSSVIVCMLALGIALGIGMRRYQFGQ